MITKNELRNNIVPIVKCYLRDELRIDLQYYDPIYTHAETNEYASTIVFEGHIWAYDFVYEYYDVIDNEITNTYFIEPCNSYEISVTKYDNAVSSERSSFSNQIDGGHEMTNEIQRGEIMRREKMHAINQLINAGDISARELWDELYTYINYDTSIPVCIACESNDAYDDDYDDTMPKLCMSCFDDALMYLILHDYINNIGDYDVPLARAIVAMNEYDDAMRDESTREHYPYVDNLSSAIDRYSYMHDDELRTHIARVFHNIQSRMN